MVCIIVLKGILCIKTYNRHPRRRKCCLSECLWLPLWKFWGFRALSLSAGNTLVASDIFCEKATIDFRRILWSVISVSFTDTMEWGWVPFFKISLAVLTWKEGDKRVQTKKGLRGRNRAGNKKIKVNFVLGIWPRTLEIQTYSHYAQVWCFKIWNTHFDDKTNQYYTCCKTKNGWWIARHCFNANLVTKGCVLE